MVAITTVDSLYVEPNEDVVECSFRSLEVISATYTGKSSTVLTPRLSKTTWMKVKQTLGKGAKAGWGLGKKLQGKKWAITVTPKKDRYRLGYRPSNYERKRQAEKCKERRMANYKGQMNNDELMTFLSLFQTFKSCGYINPNLFVEKREIATSLLTLTINATEEDKEVTRKVYSTVHPCPPDFKLNNWCSIKIPVVYKSTK